MAAVGDVTALLEELGGRAYWCLMWDDDPTILAVRLTRAGYPVVPGPVPAFLSGWPVAPGT